ncbi:MAG: UvrD-helicase domain-containing protein [Pseudomonadota bacterium]
MVSDQHERMAALDPARSFIVRAPAGSGKTELLTQRFLTLLARVQKPEEIVALTFTRKAASEMRERIISALRDADADVSVENDHERLRRDLANAVLARDTENEWQLLNNHERLRVMTIDSFNHALVRQMPLLAGFGGSYSTTDAAEALYHTAALHTLEQLRERDEYFDSICVLLRYFDNRADKVAESLSELLKNREQWLPMITEAALAEDAQLRDHFDRLLRANVESRLENLVAAIPDVLRELPPLARFAADQLKQNNSLSKIVNLIDMIELPGAQWECLRIWQAIAELLVKSDDTIRSPGGVNARIGFPAGAEAAPKKSAFKTLLEALEGADGFISNLVEIRALPNESMDAERWRALKALCRVLILASAQLQLVFAERGQVDHSELTLRALQALGDEESPSDLALSLDYRISHLMIDEFQDTSVSQFDLLRRLVRGWQADDGRTLFLVGDPMQSIYRFRQAEVGLFLRALEHGIGDVALTALTLSENFRSDTQIVDWVNTTFGSVFSEPANSMTGAVEFSASTAQSQNSGAGVKVYAHCDWQSESATVIALIRDALEKEPNTSVAVLVRGRRHLESLYPLLRENRIDYQAVDIEKLIDRPVVRDLFTLLRALWHPKDDIAWLSVLRAPWCGLLLEDLLRLSNDAVQAEQSLSAWSLNANAPLTLNQDGAQRLQRVQDCLADKISSAGRVKWSQLIRSAWVSLGGASCELNAQDILAADAFFEQLRIFEVPGATSSLADFEKQLGVSTLSNVDSPNCRVQLMTIHKAKGLEFDTVIIPNMGRRTAGNESKLVRWWQTQSGECLLAMNKMPDENEADSVYKLLKSSDRKKDDNERKRLLYVAATRAKENLHLLGHVDANKESVKPQKGSLLELIWPVVAHNFDPDSLQEGQTGDQAHDSKPLNPPLRRVPAGWVPPSPASSLQLSASNDTSVDIATDEIARPEFNWASENARDVGTVVHAFLKRIADDGLHLWGERRIDESKTQIKTLLSERGLPQESIENSIARVQTCLKNTLRDKRGRWLLGAHEQSFSEWALSGLDAKGVVVHRVIDRSFVDEIGTRWIVDYKTGEHAGGALQEFIDNEQVRYRSQLEGYAELVGMVENRPIRLGLYFPVHQEWREWSFSTD